MAQWKLRPQSDGGEILIQEIVNTIHLVTALVTISSKSNSDDF